MRNTWLIKLRPRCNLFFPRQLRVWENSRRLPTRYLSGKYPTNLINIFVEFFLFTLWRFHSGSSRRHRSFSFRRRLPRGPKSDFRSVFITFFFFAFSWREKYSMREAERKRERENRPRNPRHCQRLRKETVKALCVTGWDYVINKSNRSCMFSFREDLFVSCWGIRVAPQGAIRSLHGGARDWWPGPRQRASFRTKSPCKYYIYKQCNHSTSTEFDTSPYGSLSLCVYFPPSSVSAPACHPLLSKKWSICSKPGKEINGSDRFSAKLQVFARSTRPERSLNVSHRCCGHLSL